MIQVDNKQDLEIELGKNKKVIALFYSSWCPYCIRFLPIFKKKISVSAKTSVVEVLLDDDDNPLWVEYSVEAVPTIILFEDGEVCSRLDGRLGLGLSERQLDSWIEKIKNQ
jgi:thioredoxin 1